MKSQMQSTAIKAAVLILLSSLSPRTLWSQSTWPTTKSSKHLTLRLDPEADMSRYHAIVVGNVAYTGPAAKLKGREAEKLESLLRQSLSKDFAAVRLNSGASATRTLTANINIINV